MCGRYAASRRPEDLIVEFEAQEATDDVVLPPDYNVAPTKDVHAVLVRHGSRQLRVLRWGLVPSWAHDDSGAARRINARIETVAHRPAFRAALTSRRCLIPADGWYEWAPAPDRPGRQPYFITPADGSVLAFAGLYEWRGGSLTCAIITTAATGPLALVHDRMPVAVDRGRWAAWLDPEQAEPQRLVATPSAALLAGLELRPVGPAVGNVANNGPLLTAWQPAGAAPHALF
ncbi:MAG: SOS response-associated peptidase [Pseudonocardiales bacterium]